MVESTIPGYMAEHAIHAIGHFFGCLFNQSSLQPPPQQCAWFVAQQISRKMLYSGIEQSVQRKGETFACLPRQTVYKVGAYVFHTTALEYFNCMDRIVGRMSSPNRFELAVHK